MNKICIILIILLFTVICSYAEGNCYGTSPGQTTGIPSQSCYERLASYHIGLQVSDGMFYIDSGLDIQFNNKTYRLRFFITSTSNTYNQVQALVQTGYATRRKIEIIYPNYAITTVTNANTTALNNINCSTNSDALGNPANMYCPIQALLIME